ncbi:hypothetical protein [Vibrio sinaloensis]|uniref:hypothetical protein n=1 Tax=Photobacterium sp. (strain ATCC 43367) TaxID=379097 RepID=UPI00057FC071|nr:hypothetical protein [Vibrio sinaloensis]KHT40050.1 hypothetical protein RJ46_18220 [Vibrio sinaloensis]
MIETLKALQEAALLVPISTVTTGALAFLAVFINNFFIRRNLNKQLKVQVTQAQIQLSVDLQKATQKEKRDKLEQLHDLLHQYHSELGDFASDYRHSAFDNLSSSSDYLEKIKNHQRMFYAMRKPRSKAEVLASSYSDLIQDEFEQIRKFEEQVSDHLSMLFNLETLVLEAPSESEEKRVRAHHTPRLLESYKLFDKAESGIFLVIQQIEELIVREIKESRGFENKLVAF